MKLKLPVFTLILLIGANVCLADHFTLDIGTANANAWTVSSAGFSNVPPFVYYGSVPNGLSVTSTGRETGYFLSGADISEFDGYWTAKTSFYLPPAATNIVLNYSDLGYDDAGILFLNGVAIGATATKITNATPTPGYFVYVDGAASQPWTFTGPDALLSKVVTNNFLPERTNILSTIINNTGKGANGVLRTFKANDATSFAVTATVSYDLIPDNGSIAVGLYPGLQIDGTTGASYQLQYRTNLAGGNWVNFTNIVLPGSPYLFFDTNPITNNSSKYYRLSSSAEHLSLEIGTPEANVWTVSAAGISNVPPYVNYTNTSGIFGLSVTSTADGNGYFLLGTNLSEFDGFWTANTTFYLPSAATNIILDYSNLGYDDAGVLFLNDTAIAATATTASSTNEIVGQFVFVDGAASLPRSFAGPEGFVSGIVTNGFIPGGTNTLGAIINNTGHGPSGNLQDVSGGFTWFSVAATMSYDLNPVAGSLAIELDPGLQITGTIGGMYQLQYTTNVAGGNWTALTNIVLPTSAYVFFDLDAITNRLSRSYRVVTQ